MATAVQVVEEYLQNGRNGTQAYLKVKPHVTVETARAECAKLLAIPCVSAYLDKREQDLRAKYQLTTNDLVKNLSQALHFDPRKLYNADGTLKNITELDDDTIVGLAGVEVVEMASEGSCVAMLTKKVKWSDKNAVREQAMKHLGMFKDSKPPHLIVEINTIKREIVRA